MKPTRKLMVTQFHNDYKFTVKFNDWVEDKKVYEILVANDKILVFFKV